MLGFSYSEQIQISSGKKRVLRLHYATLHCIPPYQSQVPSRKARSIIVIAAVLLFLLLLLLLGEEPNTIG